VTTSTFQAFASRLKLLVAGPLPGAAAQAHLAPMPKREFPAGFNPAHLRHAAGLLLTFPIDDRPHIVLTVRADGLGRHGGQVSLPGGVIEPGETIEAAALREAHEEVGLDPSRVQAVGTLSPLDIPVSGFRLHPVVAITADEPELSPSAGEVARILRVSVNALMERGALRRKSMTRDGRTLDVPYFELGDIEVWGATAMVLAEFLTLLEWRGFTES
jgi:8-oxo-dGTP pyrophosphatase MutT (NUDIX family)